MGALCVWWRLKKSAALFRWKEGDIRAAGILVERKTQTMKKGISIGLALLLGLLGLTACSAPHTSAPLQTPMPMPTATIPPETPQPSFVEDSLAQSASYNRYALPQSLRSGEGFSTALYKQIVDASLTGEASVQVDVNQVSAAQMDGVRSFVLSRGRIQGLTDISLEGSTLTLKYATEDKEAVKAAAEQFDLKAQEFLSQAYVEGMTTLELAMSLYQALAQRIVYSYDALDDSLYAAIVNLEGDSAGYAYAYAFLLDQAGIENVVVISEDETHLWNVITVDGQSYHVDLTFNASLSEGQSIKFFGMNDDQAMLSLGHTRWTAAEGQGEQEVPQCSSDRFAALWTGERSDMDYSSHTVYTDEMQGERVVALNLMNGEISAVLERPTNGFAVLDGVLYFIDAADGCMYSLVIESGEETQLFEGVKVVSLNRKGQQLHYSVEDDAEVKFFEP